MGEPPPLADPIIMEERVESMVSPMGSDPFLRTAHFLKPTITNSNFPPSPHSKTTHFDIRKTPLRVKFRGKICPEDRWRLWVQKLQPKYQHIWEKAGIYDSIIASTYKIIRHNDLIVALGERWCLDTNTFVFPWGESTITLEDMMVLWGYSVLGESVLSPLDTKKLIKIEESLIQAWKSFNNRFVSHAAWMNRFMDNEDELEHETFLALWLSIYVFSTKFGGVTKNVFPIAVHLSRGTKIALAPSVLASVYNDLSLLKRSLISSANGEGNKTGVYVWAPIQVVQVWAWERFPGLRPNPNPICIGDPRLARWHKLDDSKVESIRKIMDSAGEDFQWRPYCVVVNNWRFNGFYGANKEWVRVKSSMDVHMKSLILCIRPSELVGLGCIEQYLPHRVAMQFGLDQDVPGDVPRVNDSTESAWRNYKRPIGDKNIYIPPRLFESDVSARYFAWWDHSSLGNKHSINSVKKKPKSNTNERLYLASDRVNEDNELVSSDEDNLTIKELMKRNLNAKAVDEGFASENKLLFETGSQSKALLGRPSTGNVKPNSSVSSISDIKKETTFDDEVDESCYNLEKRISRLEKLVSVLKTEELGSHV